MPKLLEEKQVKLDREDLVKWTQVLQPKNVKKRSSGVHLSGVIKAVLQATGQMKFWPETEEISLNLAMGLAWENWIVGLYPDLIWQPGEMCKDGIYGSPDGITPDIPQLEEFKCTWKSRHNFGTILDQKAWMWQLQGYLAMLGTPWYQARIHVFFVNGDYRPPTPEYFTYVIEFTSTELDQFWTRVIVPNKDRAKAEEHK